MTTVEEAHNRVYSLNEDVDECVSGVQRRVDDLTRKKAGLAVTSHVIWMMRYARDCCEALNEAINDVVRDVAEGRADAYGRGDV